MRPKHALSFDPQAHFLPGVGSFGVSPTKHSLIALGVHPHWTRTARPDFKSLPLKPPAPEAVRLSLGIRSRSTRHLRQTEASFTLAQLMLQHRDQIDDVAFWSKYCRAVYVFRGPGRDQLSQTREDQPGCPRPSKEADCGQCPPQPLELGFRETRQSLVDGWKLARPPCN